VEIVVMTAVFQEGTLEWIRDIEDTRIQEGTYF
jgi:hypothetical protein